MANSVDPDQIPHSVASDLGLHCLLSPICPSIQGNYCMASLFCAFYVSVITGVCDMICCSEV